MIESSERDWWLTEAEKLENVSDRDKWRMINRLTNHSSLSHVQPIRKVDENGERYLFDDDEIRLELENHHIRKHNNNLASTVDDDVNRTVEDLTKAALEGKGTQIMNESISDYEVKNTFGTGSDTPGPDGISAKLIDKADRERMHVCLKLLWSKAWDNGHFVSEWKHENSHNPKTSQR